LCHQDKNIMALQNEMKNHGAIKSMGYEKITGKTARK